MGHHSAVRMLLGLGADVDAGSSQSGWSPLVVASWVRDNAGVEILVAHGASVDHRCSTGCNFTPLSAAAASESFPICSALFAAGANVDYAVDLMLASEFGEKQSITHSIRLLKPSSVLPPSNIANSLTQYLGKVWAGSVNAHRSVAQVA